MKKLLSFICLIVASSLLITMSACDKDPNRDEPTGQQPPVVYFSNDGGILDELLVVKGETISVDIKSGEQIESASIKFTNTDDNVIFYTQDGMKLNIKGTIAGETELNLVYSGKIVHTLCVTVKEADLSVRLPEGKIVLDKGSIATVQAVCNIESQDDPVWEVSTDSIQLTTQGYIARIKVSDECPNGEYTAKVKVGDKECTFTIIVGSK